MNTKQGEVWLADLGIAAKTRPVVVVSRYDANPPRVLVIYVPPTTQYRNSKYEVVLPNLKFLNQSSIANVQGIGSIPIARLERIYCVKCQGEAGKKSVSSSKTTLGRANLVWSNGFPDLRTP
jgi:mRNA interferase MazF